MSNEQENKENITMKKDTKIQITKGCTDYLIQEVESLRRENQILSAEKRIVDGFFNMFDRIGDKRSQGYSEDLLWQAKREIAEATKKVEFSE